MIHQEEIYQLIFKEKWQDILDILYQHKEDIANDTILQYAATTFETEFFKKVSDYAIDNKIINDNLDTLYALHHGKFYLLKPESLKTLTIEMVKRNPINEAYNYALQCPEDDICKDVIKKYESQFGKQGSETQIVQTQTSRNWIEIYNRLFELINEKDDAATYFAGPRFIKVIKEFNPYFPDYTQYIELRNQQGKSTSRKIFYYDILLEQDEPIRLKIIDSILNMVKPFQPEKVIAIEMILGKQSIDVSVVASTEIYNEQSMHPVVFISYSWDDEAHKEWVLKLADRLTSNGIEVILDKYELRAGKSLPYFVEQSIKRADRIIIVFTPNYKLKADKRSGGVGYEYSIMNVEILLTHTALFPLLN